MRGRGFEPLDGTPGRDDRVIISEPLWRQRFSGHDTAIGQAIVLNDRSFTVVGVMPRHFRFPASHQQVWLPAATSQPAGVRLMGYAKIKRGLTRDTARFIRFSAGVSPMVVVVAVSRWG